MAKVRKGNVKMKGTHSPTRPPAPERTTDRPELDEADETMAEGMSTEAAAVDDEESLASLGNEESVFTATASGSATGQGIDRGTATSGAPGSDLPGWRFGWESATDPDLAGRPFEEVETELESRWELRGRNEEGDWEDVRESVRDAFGRAPRASR